MRAHLAALLALSACGFRAPSTQAPDDGPRDGTTGMEKPPDDAALCFGSFVTVCLESMPTGPKTFDVDTTIDTGTASCAKTTNPAATAYCVIAADGITLSGDHTINAKGAKPLVLLSTSTIDITGTIDVSSHHDAMPQLAGAGANPTGACNGFSVASGGSGGAGGSFGGKGGNGEARGGNAGTASPALTAAPQTLRGGCAGTNGATAGGNGGAGGGAIALIAAGKLTLDGTIDASGSGGQGGMNGGTRGGGGGGSGGMIVLDAQTIMVTATSSIFANGGGGGQGGSGPAAGDSGGESTAPATAALRGMNPIVDGGSGGNGSAGTVSADGSDAIGNAQQSGGGGAGGGGAGFIRTTGTLNANVAPMPR